jgi:hypothetical protein
MTETTYETTMHEPMAGSGAPRPTAAETARAWRRWGGVAALVEAATYLIGFALLATVLAPLAGDLDAEGFLALLAERRGLMTLWHLIIYVVNGAFLAVLVLAIHDHFAARTPVTARVATAFGLIWSGLVLASGMLILHDLGVVAELAQRDPAQAATVWTALQAVEGGLGGGVELPGGIWVLLVSLAAIRTGAFLRALNAFGILVGLAGILTLIPPLDPLGAVFGLGMILWFLAIGITLLRTPTPTP